MYCPQCKTVLNDHEQQCPKCNAEIPEKVGKEAPVKTGAETLDEFDRFLDGIGEEPDDFIAGIQNEVRQFLDLLEEEISDGDPSLDPATEEIIELRDIVTPTARKDDDSFEEITQKNIEPAVVAAEKMPEDILSVEYLAYDDDETARTIDLDSLEDQKTVKDPSDENLEAVLVPEKTVGKKVFVRRTAQTTRPISKIILVLAGIFLLLAAAVFGIRFYLKPKMVAPVLPSKLETAVSDRERAPLEHADGKQEQKVSGPSQGLGGRELPAESRTHVKLTETATIQKRSSDRDFQTQRPVTETSNIDTSGAKTPTVQSKAESPEPPQAEAPAEKTVSVDEPFETGRSYFTIQVLSFITKSYAEAGLQRLKQDGHPAYLVAKENTDGTMVYKLRIGKYKTLNQARNAAESLYDAQIKSYIIVQSEAETSP